MRVKYTKVRDKQRTFTIYKFIERIGDVVFWDKIEETDTIEEFGSEQPA